METQAIDSQDSSLQLVLTVAQAAEERKGTDITILRITEVSSLADYFVIVTGFSKVQLRAIARAIEEKVEQDLQRPPPVEKARQMVPGFCRTIAMSLCTSCFLKSGSSIIWKRSGDMLSE